MLKVRIVNERQKKKSIGKGDIRYARFFFLVRENFRRLRIDIYDIVDGWRRQTRLHGAWRHECNDIYVLRGSRLVRDWRRIADPGSSRRNATPGRPVTSPAAAIPYILISVPSWTMAKLRQVQPVSPSVDPTRCRNAPLWDLLVSINYLFARVCISKWIQAHQHLYG